MSKWRDKGKPYTLTHTHSHRRRVVSSINKSAFINNEACSTCNNSSTKSQVLLSVCVRVCVLNCLLSINFDTLSCAAALSIWRLLLQSFPLLPLFSSLTRNEEIHETREIRKLNWLRRNAYTLAGGRPTGQTLISCHTPHTHTYT